VSTTARREIPAKVRELRLGDRIRWARRSAGLSHDRLVEALGRSNRGHLIKIERGDHIPRADLRDAIADATNVPRELFADEDEEEDPAMFAGAIQRMFDRAITLAATRGAEAALAAREEEPGQ
jgi:transcriptional regulator with XRE-family HTH domain